MADLSSYNRQPMACKAVNIYPLTLYRKSVPTPALISFQQIPILLKSARAAHHQEPCLIQQTTRGWESWLNSSRSQIHTFLKLFSKCLKVYPGSLFLLRVRRPSFRRILFFFFSSFQFFCFVLFCFVLFVCLFWRLSSYSWPFFF